MPRTTTLTHDHARHVALVGTVVTYADRQWTIHSIEGHDWYAHQGAGGVIVDTGLTPSMWVKEPVATLVPMGHVIGDGHSESTPAGRVKRGVCLVKAYA